MLKALTSERSAEAALHLMDVFLTISAPTILQSDKGTEFTASVISEISRP